MSQINLCDVRFDILPHLFFSFCITCVSKRPKHVRTTLNPKGEIKRLGFVSGEKISLLAHFTEHVEKIAIAVSCLDEFDTDEDKRTYLRSLISPFSMFTQILSKHG
jgi:hypothetical protein